MKDHRGFKCNPDSFFGKIFEKIKWWYSSPFSGIVTMTINLINMVFIPKMKFYEDTGYGQGIKTMVIMQTVINFIFLIDLILMFVIFGVKKVMLEMAYSLRIEAIFQITFFALITQAIQLY